MPGAGQQFGRRFCKGGSAFYCGRVFTARHMSCVSSPLATGFIKPTAFLSVTGVNAAALCGAPTAQDILTATASDDLTVALPRGLLGHCGVGPTLPMLALPLVVPIVRMDGEKRATTWLQ